MGNTSEISLRERIRLNLLFSMEQANINQVQLAERLGISKGTVNNWARGNNSPDVDMVPRICKVLGISILDLYSPTRFELQESKKSPSAAEAAPGEQVILQKYRLLDPYGKEAVDGVLDVEWRRCTSPAKAEPADADRVVYITAYYPNPASAGTEQEDFDGRPDELELTKRPPRGTSYVIHVDGESMEPTYHHGDKLFIQAQEEIEPGQIGIFFMDGRQWVKELGDGELISHAPGYDPRPMTEDVRCQGLVLGVCDESYFE